MTTADDTKATGDGGATAADGKPEAIPAADAASPSEAAPPGADLGAAPATTQGDRDGRSASGRSRRPTREARPRSGRKPSRDAAGSGDGNASLLSKLGRGPLIAIVAVVLIVCVLLGCGALAGVGLFGNDKAKVESAMATADARWQKATADMEKAAAAMATVKSAAGPTTSKTVAAASAEASQAVGAAQVELKAAAVAVDGMPESKVKTSYKSAIAEADAALAGIDSIVEVVQVTNRAYGVAATGGTYLRNGTDQLGAAILAVNAGDYSTAKSKAAAASASIESARKTYAAGQAVDITEGFDKAVAYSITLANEAKVVSQLAAAGSANNLVAFNRLAAQQAALQKTIGRLQQPALLTNRQAVVRRIETIAADVRKHLVAAQRLYAQARTEFQAMTK